MDPHIFDRIAYLIVAGVVSMAILAAGTLVGVGLLLWHFL
jgi:hypothetical protein